MLYKVVLTSGNSDCMTAQCEGITGETLENLEISFNFNRVQFIYLAKRIRVSVIWNYLDGILSKSY